MAAIVCPFQYQSEDRSTDTPAVNRDDFISRYLNTNFHREEILEGIL